MGGKTYYDQGDGWIVALFSGCQHLCAGKEPRSDSTKWHDWPHKEKWCCKCRVKHKGTGVCQMHQGKVVPHV